MHSHYEMFVRARCPNDVVEVLMEKLEPYSENYEGRKRRGKFYDWCQVGGRWRGVHVNGKVIPPGTKEKCEWCDGTGRRADEMVQGWYRTAKEGTDEEKAVHAFKLEDFTVRPDGVAEVKCNGCDGAGERSQWPTQWPMHDEDALPVKENEERIRKMFDGEKFFGYVMNEENVFNVETGKWMSKEMIEEVLRDGVDMYLVTVDCHD